MITNIAMTASIETRIIMTPETYLRTRTVVLYGNHCEQVCHRLE